VGLACFALWLCLWLPGLAVRAAPQAPGDTLIDGRSYALLPVEVLAAQLRQARGPVRHRQVAFAGRLAGIDTVRFPVELTEVRFLDELALDGVVCRAPLFCAGAVFQGGLSLRGSRFERELELNACQFRGAFSANQAVFGGRTSLEGSRFFAAASFIAARFAGPETRFDRARFEEGAYFEEARFAGPARFADGYFEGLSSFKNASWEDRAEFAGARFKDRSFFWSAAFAGPVSFDEARFGSETAFNQARFAGPASFRRITFVHPARFAETHFAAGADFAGSLFKRLADFSGSQAAAPLELTAFFSGDVDLRRGRAPLLDLRPPAEAVPDNDSTGASRLYLQDSRFAQALARWEQLPGRLASQDSVGVDDLAPVYAFLEQQFRAQGLDRDARACRREWLERQRRALPWTRGEKYLLLGWWLTSGYSADLGQFFLFSLCLVLLFALLYRLGRSSLRPLRGAGSPSLGECLYLSLQVFIRFKPAAWQPLGGWRWLMIGQAVASWLCWGLFIATLIRLLS